MSRVEAERRGARGRGLLSAPADFWRLWFVGFVLFAVRWLEMLAVAVFVYERTGSAFLVAVVTMLRIVPMGLFGAFIGAAADRLDRRRALIGVVALMLTTSAVLALLAATGRLEVWHLACASVLNGIGWAMDNPVRRVMVGEVVGPERMGAAMSIDVGTNNASRMLARPRAGSSSRASGSKAPSRSAPRSTSRRSARAFRCATGRRRSPAPRARR